MFEGVTWVTQLSRSRESELETVSWGPPLRERHQSLVHCEKRRSKIPLALPTAAPGVPG